MKASKSFFKKINNFFLDIALIINQNLSSFLIIQNKLLLTNKERENTHIYINLGKLKYDDSLEEFGAALGHFWTRIFAFSRRNCRWDTS